MTERLCHQSPLVALCAVIYFLNLGATHLWEEDEAYFGRTAQEMAERGDLVVPYLNGEISLHKPALMYWVMIGGTRLFGPTEFALRFGSVLFSIANVLVTYHLGRLLFSPRAGFWSGLILATCLHFALVAQAVVADPELILFCTLPLLILVAGTNLSRERQSGTFSASVRATQLSWPGWALAYAAMGAAALAKGPVGVVLPTAVIGLFLLLSRADGIAKRSVQHSWLVRLWTQIRRVFSPAGVLRTIWEMRPCTAIAMIALVAAPWYAAVGARTDGEWLHGFFFVHNYGRFVSSSERHSGGPFYYLVAICVGTYPWCMFNYQGVRQALIGLHSASPHRPAYLLLCSWIAVWVGAFTLAGTKLPHYVLPAYPAIALILGDFVADWSTSSKAIGRLSLRVAWATPMLVGIGMLVAVPIVARMFLPGEERLAWIGLIPLLGGIVGLWADEQRRPRLAITAASSMAVLFLIALLGWAAERVDRHQKSPVVASWMRELAPDRQASVAAFGCFEASLLYYCDRNIEKLRRGGAGEFFTNHPGEAYMITTDRVLPEIEDNLPSDVPRAARNTPFLKPERLLLLGRESAAMTTGAHGPTYESISAN